MRTQAVAVQVIEGDGMFGTMTATWWMGCVTFLLTATATATAYADPGVEERLEGCEGLPARGRIARSEAVGEDAVYVVPRSGDRLLVFPKEEDRGCEVYAIGRAAVSTSGSFGSASKAVALKPRRCAGNNCIIAVMVNGKDDKPLMALRTDANCDDSVELRPIKLFATRDSIEMVCHGSAGAGWKERRVLFDVSEDTLVTLYSLDTGSYIAPSPAEKKAGIGPSCPVGSIQVEKVGDKPVLRVVDPASGTLHDGKGTVPARQLCYDAKKHEFKPSGAPDKPTDVDAHAGCRRR
jgi:hypothetical protein